MNARKVATEDSHGIEIIAISKKFVTLGKEIPVFKDVSLTLAANKIIVIIGASGSGKSTLLNLLSGLDHVDTGEIIIAGQDITKMNERQLAHFRNVNIGFVFQQHQLIGELTVFENIILPANISKRNFVEKDHEEKAIARGLGLLERTGLVDRKDHLIGELSGGEMQRVSIIRALINSPSVILADEPTGDLDEANAGAVFALLQELSRAAKSTVVMVTHDLYLAQKADLVYELKDQLLREVRLRPRSR